MNETYRFSGSYFKWIVRLFLLICLVLVVFPILWLVMSSFKNQMEFLADPMATPSVWRFANYVTAWKEMHLSVYLLNSLFLVVATAALHFLMVSTTSYILAKIPFKLNKGLELYYFFAMMIPAVLMLTPLYFLFDSVGFTDSLGALVLIYASVSLPTSIFLVTGFMRNINNAFTEAAFIDGANEFQIFWSVILPLVKPVLFFSVIGNIMGTWNEYTTALTFISTPEKYPVSIGLHFMETSVGDKGVVFAGLVIALVPVLVIYGLFQKQIQNGVSADEGVKG
ncbi:MAG: carbohydrate ABC transporter permease [Clostridia bacterium]|nr:carbohydrate ABC transporter permease [Clostridia bacterium]